MSQEPICPCEDFVHPRPLFNPPGRGSLLYRVGDFATFREALLQPRTGEVEFAGWRPSARGDLALQLLEWWAYLADILTFYNERIAQDAYLRTATTPGSVERLVRLLGYRPRPGLGASGVLAALLDSRTPLTLPRGLAIQSKPVPGEKPEIFELDEDTDVEPSGALAAEVVAPTNLAGRTDVLLRGSVTTVREGEQVLLVSKGWADASDQSRGYAVMTVKAVSREKDARSRPVTRVTFGAALPEKLQPTSATPALATDYRLLKAGQTALLFPYGSISASDTTVHLESLFRSARPGAQLLLVSTSGTPTLVGVTKYAEQLWYANDVDPTQAPPDPAVPVPIPHTVLTFEPSAANTAQVRFGWQEVGELIDEPPKSVWAPDLQLALEGPLPLPEGATARDVLLEDSTGQGIQGRATPIGDPAAQQVLISPVDEAAPSVSLTPPLRLLYNLLQVSRGATVVREVLGSGDSSSAGQCFMLRKSPLTYLPEGTDSRSTLRIQVDGIEWKEVRSFHGQLPHARVFVTREDEEQKTHVLFGDGVHGARLPTGVENVVASYRYGSGASAPAAGALSVLLQSRPGLQAVRNPVPMSGGADPDSPALLRQLAPRSVLTFNRAISAGDYEAIALDQRVVKRARAYGLFDAEQQRPLIRLYVGDTLEAKRAAEQAIRGASDPQRRVEVRLARKQPILLTLDVVKDSRFSEEDVEKGLRRALRDPETGLFGEKTARIGATVYDSQIHEACLRIPGVLAVHALSLVPSMLAPKPTVPAHPTRVKLAVDARLFVLMETRTASSEHSPGEGGFYVIEDDTHLVLNLKEAAPHG